MELLEILLAIILTGCLIAAMIMYAIKSNDNE